MITVIARLQILPGKENLALPALQDMAHAVQTREPGCLMYHVTRSLVNVSEIYVYELYEDENALAEHSKSEHMTKFRAGLDEWGDRAHFNVETMDGIAGFARANVSI
jgi:quinol monooxygenase YgiN